MTLERDVLDRISPSEDERREIDQRVRALLAVTAKEARKADPALGVLLVGSVAKDTFLKDPDLDVFILFPDSVPRERLESTGLGIGRKILDQHEERYAEHPYIHGSWEGLEVDMVPCYRIKDTTRLRSAVDRTPFHTAYVKGHLKEEQKDEVRLLKQFAKGIGAYGAEAKTQGFSGYLIELLVMRYGTFTEVLRVASGWRRGTVIQLEQDSNKRFTEPLVFLDPVDGNRNVASALSGHSLALFVHAARSYLRGPSERFFFPARREPLDLDRMEEMVQERGTGILLVRLDRPTIIDDNLYPQTRRTMDGLCSLLSSHDFKIVDRGFYVSTDIRFVIELESLDLPLGQRHGGPPAWVENSSAFLERWRREGLSRPYLENGHWAVIAPRSHTRAETLVRAKLHTAALGSNLRELAGLSVCSGSNVFTSEHRASLSSLLDKRLNWEV
jgi:tRNA nucleotidyltransferase (CCA-adding enzyme)